MGLLRRVIPLVLLAAIVWAPVTAKAHAAPFRAVPGLHAIEDARHASDQLNLTPSTTPIIPRQVNNANPLLRREIFGFAPYWLLNDNAEWNFSLLSTIAYFGLNVNADGTFVTSGPGWNGWNSADLTAIINKAHSAGDRVVLVIKDFNDSSINNVVTTAAMQTLINGVIAAMAAKSLDGVNVDFEGSGDPRFPDIQLGITTLMTALSTQVHARFPGSEVSIDTYAGSASWDGGIFKIGDLAPVVDAMFVMNYDSVFSNMPGQAGPNSPMNGWTYNDTLDVAQYLTKAPASKVILGVPYYGYVWSTRDGLPYSQTTNSGQAISYTGAIGNLTCGGIAQTIGWDALGQSPWTAWWSPRTNDPCGDNLGAPREMYFDNATSLGIKYDLVNSSNLRGTGMWTLGYDAGRTELWNELAVKFIGASAWSSLGGTLTSGPDASSWGPNRADVFTRDATNGLEQAVWNGTVLGNWVPLGGGITSDPGAVSWGPNRIDIFARGQNNGLWHLAWNGSSWSGWYPLGGVLGSGPDVASWGANRLDVFALGQNKGLWHMSWNGSAWSGWESLGGVLTSDPTAVSWGPNRIDVFAKGQDNGLWHLAWGGSSWTGWQSLGGALTSGPDAASCTGGHLDVFAAGTGGALMQLGFNGFSWTSWKSLGNQWTADPGAACSTVFNGIDVFERGATDNALWHIEVPAS